MRRASTHYHHQFSKDCPQKPCEFATVHRLVCRPRDGVPEKIVAGGRVDRSSSKPTRRKKRMTKIVRTGFAAVAILAMIGGSAFAQGVSVGSKSRGAPHGSAGSSGISGGLSGSSSTSGSVRAPGAGSVGVHSGTTGQGSVSGGTGGLSGSAGTGANVGAGAHIGK
jgi:hypothetical protein